MTESNVAQDQIKAFVDRILRMKEEAKAINADIREIYAEAKGSGFDKTVLGQLVSYVEKRQTDAATLAERSALFELYLEAFDGSSGRPSHAHTRERASKLTYGEHLDDVAKASVDPVAALRADPAMSIVDVANLKKKSEPQGNEVAASPAQMPSAGGVAPAESAATTSPDRVEGIVDGQPIQPETANAGEAQVEERRSPKPEAAGSIPATHAKYAAPGEVTWETHPPEGVERGAISMAFGWAGQDSAVIADDLEKGKAQPIVKKGNIILDGWARYMAARNMRNLDGSPVAYPVVQYNGSDLLVDIIKLNVNGRILSEDDKRRIAANLARQEPSRKDDIYRAFELWMEPV